MDTPELIRKPSRTPRDRTEGSVFVRFGGHRNFRLTGVPLTFLPPHPPATGEGGVNKRSFNGSGERAPGTERSPDTTCPQIKRNGTYAVFLLQPAGKETGETGICGVCLLQEIFL